MIPRHWLHYQLAQFYLAVRLPKRAARAFEAALEAHALYELAKAHHALHHVEDVRKIIARVSDFDPQITTQLIRETGLLPAGVEPTQRAAAARR